MVSVWSAEGIRFELSAADGLPAKPEQLPESHAGGHGEGVQRPKLLVLDQAQGAARLSRRTRVQMRRSLGTSCGGPLSARPSTAEARDRTEAKAGRIPRVSIG